MNETIGTLMSRLAQTNIELWHEEDKARVEDDHQVAAAKRRVDALNQVRNDLIEQIDAQVRRVSSTAETRTVAETVGSLADKLSIIELKIYHMREQAERSDVDHAFRARCHDRLSVMLEQRDDLALELGALFAAIAAGRVTPRVYRQFKMYNDPQYKMPEA